MHNRAGMDVDIDGLWRSRLQGDEEPQQEWLVPFLALMAYTLLTIAGYFTQMASLLNVIGAGAFTYILAIGNFRRLLRLSADPTVVLALAIVVHIIFSTLINFDIADFRIATKLSVIFVVYALLFSYRYVPLSKSVYKYKIMLLVAIPLGLSYVVGGMPGILVPLQGRISGGIYVVPNALSQVSFIMLFLLKDDDKLLVKLLAHGVVIAFIAFSASSGMMLGYLVAMAYKHWRVIAYPKAMFAAALTLVGFTLVVIVLDVDLRRSFFIKRFIAQHELVLENYDYAMAGSEINYAKIIKSNREYEQGTSGLWRVSFWMGILNDYKRSDLLHQVLGHGLSYAKKNFGREPHNEYIRVLVEFGVLGVLLFAAFIVIVLWRFDSRYRYLVIMLLVTAASANDMDNCYYMMMVMSMFVSYQRKPEPAFAEGGSGIGSPSGAAYATG